MKRLEAIRDSDVWPKMNSGTSRKWIRTEKFWENMMKKLNRKSAAKCGRDSKSANPNFRKGYIRKFYFMKIKRRIQT